MGGGKLHYPLGEVEHAVARARACVCVCVCVRACACVWMDAWNKGLVYSVYTVSSLTRRDPHTSNAATIRNRARARG